VSGAPLLAHGLLFDLDGVLVDSTPAVERVWRAWAIKHGFDPDATVTRAHGRPSIETLRELLPNGDYRAENRIVEQGEIDDLEGVVAMPGALALLTSLPPDQWAVVTSCTRPLAEARWGASGLPRPRQWITSSDIAHGKPAPDAYLAGAALLGLPPGDCLVFEDAPAGVRAGKAAGCRVVAFTTMATPATLREAGADWITTGCSALRLTATAPHLELTLNAAVAG
jgi:sugar-phosphatase